MRTFAHYGRMPPKNRPSQSCQHHTQPLDDTTGSVLPLYGVLVDHILSHTCCTSKSYYSHSSRVPVGFLRVRSGGIGTGYRDSAGALLLSLPTRSQPPVLRRPATFLLLGTLHPL